MLCPELASSTLDLVRCPATLQDINGVCGTMRLLRARAHR